MSDSISASIALHPENHSAFILSHPQHQGALSTNAGDVPIDADTVVSPGVAIMLLYLLLFLMVGAQVALFVWKKKHKKSYELVTLMGLWVMPAIFSIQLHFWRFMTVWVVFSAVTGYLIYQCSQKKLASSTPRRVYGWFIGVYKVSTFLGFTGYVLILLEVFGLGELMRFILPKGFSLLLLWYGLYFGILGRDCAEVASDRMAATMSRCLQVTVNNCGICGGELKDFSHLGEEVLGERCIQLSCKHCFHDFCIRGWTMVGKKDMCPVCLEKVDLRNLYSDRPWETRNLSWIQMLDAIRYMVVWNPIIFFIFSCLFHLFGPHHHHELQHSEPVVSVPTVSS